MTKQRLKHDTTIRNPDV